MNDHARFELEYSSRLAAVVTMAAEEDGSSLSDASAETVEQHAGGEDRRVSRGSVHDGRTRTHAGRILPPPFRTDSTTSRRARPRQTPPARPHQSWWSDEDGRDEAEEDGGDGDAGGDGDDSGDVGGEVGDDAESEHDDNGSDTDDGGAEDRPAVAVTCNACGEGTLTIVSVALASSRSGKAPSKTQKYGG